MNTTRTGIGAYPRRHSPSGHHEAARVAAMPGGILMTKQVRAERTAGYEALPLGTKFINLNGRAVPLTGIAGAEYSDGANDTGFFQATFGGDLHEIFVRVETAAEKAERHAQEQAAARRVLSSFDPGADFDCETVIWEMSESHSKESHSEAAETEAEARWKD